MFVYKIQNAAAFFNKKLRTKLSVNEYIDVAVAFPQELVVRDNQMKKIPDVTIFKMLLVFDVSFNEISSLSGLSKVSNTLKELYVSKNEVTKIEEIEHFHELQILELGSNRLRVRSISLSICYINSFLTSLNSKVCLVFSWIKQV